MKIQIFIKVVKLKPKINTDNFKNIYILYSYSLLAFP